MSKQPQANLQKAPSYFSFGFTGRIGRLEFANRFVTYLLLIITIYLLYYFAIEQGLFLLFDGNDKSTDMTRGLIKLIFHAGLFGTALLLNIRMAIMRLHDLNLSGWWTCLIFTIPYIAALFVVMLPMTLNMTLYHTIFYIVAIIAIIAQLIPFLMPAMLNQITTALQRKQENRLELACYSFCYLLGDTFSINILRYRVSL